MAALAVAIMTDETGWHTRQLQAALRSRGCAGRCIDLADCRIDTTAAWHGLVIPGFGRDLPDAVLVRGIAGGTFEQVTKRLGVLRPRAHFINVSRSPSLNAIVFAIRMALILRVWRFRRQRTQVSSLN